MRFWTLFRSERPVSTIFPPYIMSNGTYERIKIFCDTLPLSLSSCHLVSLPTGSRIRIKDPDQRSGSRIRIKYQDQGSGTRIRNKDQGSRIRNKDHSYKRNPISIFLPPLVNQLNSFPPSALRGGDKFRINITYPSHYG